MRPPVVAKLGPYEVEVQEGKSYLWCACGRSLRQPFCDTSHLGSGRNPKRFRAERSRTVKLCGCKYTRTPPFCDGSHDRIDLPDPPGPER